MTEEIINEPAMTLDEINFQTLAEDAPVTLWLTDIHGNVIFTNNQYKNFIGREKVEKLGGKAWFNALHPDDREYCLTVFKDAFATYKPFTMEYRLRRRDGEYRHFIDHGEPYIDGQGRFAGFVGSSTDITEQKMSEDELKKSHQELTQYNYEMNLINQLNSYLQVCRSIDETYPIVSYYAEQIFPDCTGALYLFNDKKSLVESMTTWGATDHIGSAPVIAPDDCWSLRQGKEHTTLDNDGRLRCKHVHEDVSNYICEPIIAQGEMLGMLHIEFCGAKHKAGEEKTYYVESRKRLVKITSDNLALSLVSLKLKEALQSQSVRDPLTHLFNRRYMEESLEREIHRCARSNHGLGLIITDIDHFKKFNDEYGHDAGDLVITEYANLLKNHFRASDIICRYGGEEFIVILPDISQEKLMQRAEFICQELASLKLLYQSKPLPTVTASFGVVYLDNKLIDKSTMIKAADVALYEAKHRGRNQVVLSESELSEAV
ncbi:sensor domain-containing diguanylate cyclase [Methylophaga lonarensis]|uniref:sensor domain-containing diguanylate cyclase n=1 Tax=Methylophaga lonarensis TaxID=999151 RepID=UPI003D2D3774